MRENPQLNILPDFKKTTCVGFAPSWPPASYSIDSKQRHLIPDDQISKTTMNGSNEFPSTLLTTACQTPVDVNVQHCE